MKEFLIILMAVGFASAALDLKRSVDRIKIPINETRHNPPDWTKLPEIIEMVLPCLSMIIGGGIFQVESDRLPTNLKQYIEGISPVPFAQELLRVNWAEVSAQRSIIEPSSVWDDLKEFMNSPQFKTIHDKVWKDEEILDLVGYIYTANYGDIYAAIKKFYEDMGRPDMEGLPTGPPLYYSSSPPATRKASSVPTTGATNNFPTITMKHSLFKADDPTCNLADLGFLVSLIQLVNDANIHHVIKILLYTLQEFIGNAAMHVLALKVGETQKGASFNDILALPAMQEFFPLAQGVILEQPEVAQINNIVHQLTGLSLKNPDLFKYIVDLIKYLVWNHPFPAPTPAP